MVTQFGSYLLYFPAFCTRGLWHKGRLLAGGLALTLRECYILKSLLVNVFFRLEEIFSFIFLGC